MKDPIVEEVRRIREAIAAEYNNDFGRQLAAMRLQSRKWPAGVVSFAGPPRKLKRVMPPDAEPAAGQTPHSESAANPSDKPKL
ncbi:MAG TPA: hypothetical protein VGM84_17530 [Steroidobacteraceae bacterium]|jgi:hypothetical protein